MDKDKIDRVRRTEHFACAVAEVLDVAAALLETYDGTAVDFMATDARTARWHRCHVDALLWYVLMILTEAEETPQGFREISIGYVASAFTLDLG